MQWEKKNNNTKKNIERPFAVVNQHPENQTTFINTSHRIVPGEKCYSKALTYNSTSDGRNIKQFCDSFPKRIRIKELNECINNGNAQQYSFTGATSKQLLHYLHVNLNNSTDTALFHIGINDILNSILKVNKSILNLKDMVKKCRNFVVKQIFASGLVYTKKINIKILEDIYKKLISVFKEMHVHFIDKRIVRRFNLFKDGLHLLVSGKWFLANNFVDNGNNFLSVMHRPSLFP